MKRTCPVLLLLASALASCGARPDAEVRHLRQLYVGRDVWVYGGGPLRCHTRGGWTDLRGPVSTPVRVQAVQRSVHTVHKEHRVRMAQVIERGVLLRVRPSTGFYRTSSRLGENARPVRPLEGRDCATFLLPFADGADLQRTLSLTPPDAATLASAGRLSSLGLTARQVLWLHGQPDEPWGDLNEVLRAEQWRWLGPPGRDQDVVFHFREGRVVRAEEPSPLY